MKKYNFLNNVVKITLTFFLSTGLLISCSNDKKGENEKPKTATSAGESEGELSDSLKLQLTDAANEICDCISDMENEMSGAARNIIVKAGNSNQPKKTIEEEVSAITDSTEREKIKNELSALKNSNALDCIDGVSKKYPGLKNTAKKGKRLSDLVEEHCSEFAAALIKMGR